MQEKNKKLVCASNATKSEEGLWIIDRKYELLLFWDFEKKIVNRIEAIPCETMQEWAFLSMLEEDNKIVLAPNNEKDIFIFDIVKKTFTEIEIENSCVGMFRNVVKLDNRVVLIPNYYNRIVSLELCSLHLSYGACWKDVAKGDFLRCSCECNKQIVAITNIGEVLEYNIENNMWTNQCILENRDVISVTSINNMICIFDINQSEVVFLDNPDYKIVQRKHIDCKYAKINRLNDNHIIVDSMDKAEVWIFNEKLEILYHKSEEIQKAYLNKEYEFKYHSVWVQSINNYYELTYDHKINCYDNSFEKTSYKMKYEKEIESIMENIIVNRLSKMIRNKETGVIAEDSIIGLKELLSAI